MMRLHVRSPFFLKGAILAIHHKGGDVIPVLSSFVGCSEFMPASMYVVDLTYGSSPDVTEFTSVSAVDVSFCIGFFYWIS